MKKALIIGGTQSFGKDVTLTYLKLGYSVDVIGRSPVNFAANAHYVLDLFEVEKRKQLFTQLFDENKYSDIACVVGYARSQSESDFRKSQELNVEYVRDVFALCSKCNSTNNIITIGSQWSLKDNFEPLQNYISAKHELRKITIDFAKSSPIRANHYCVPTMYTNQLLEVQSSFERAGIPMKPANNQIHNPQDIAQTLVNYDLVHKPNAKTFFVRQRNMVELVD